MRKFGLTSFIIYLFSCAGFAQVAGDYRSAVSGVWSDLNNWERYSGVSWATPTALEGYPGFSNSPATVTIIEEQTMTLDVTPTLGAVNLVVTGDGDGDFVAATLNTSGDPSLTLTGSITIGDVAVMDFFGSGNLTVAGNISIADLLASFERGGSGNLTVVGNFSVGDVASFATFSTTGNVTITGTTTAGIASFITDNENTGVSTFVGLVTMNIGIWTSTAVTTSANMVFRGGITNSLGSFAAGGATFDINSQTLSGTISFTSPVVITGVTVTNSGTITISSTAAGALSGTGTWTQNTGTRTLNYAGSTLTVATFNASSTNNTVNYNSTTVAQTFRVPSTTYAILTLNNTSGTSPQFTAGGNISVTTTLNMTSGITNLAGNTFTLGSSGVASDLNRTASTTTNWMYGGTFTRFWLNATAVSSTAGNLYGLFPVGTSTASSYRPVAINSTANPTATGSFSVTHTDASTSTDLSPVYDDAGTNIVRKNDAQFVTSSSGVTGGTYNISVTMTGLAAGTLSDIRLAVSNGATTVTNVGTHSAATGTAPNPTATRTGVTPVGNLVGDFRITTTNSTATPLPIVLQYFIATVDGGIVKTEWATAREINNESFTVQKTTDFETFHEVGVINGQGNSRDEHVYFLEDDSPFIGKSYYRLKQTDFDGKFTFSDPVMINYDGPTSVSLKAYPNPFNGKKIIIELNGLKDRNKVPIQIFNQQGEKLYEVILTEDGPGVLKEEVYFSTTLPMGIYIIKAGKTLQLTRKIVVN